MPSLPFYRVIRLYELFSLVLSVILLNALFYHVYTAPSRRPGPRWEANATRVQQAVDCVALFRGDPAEQSRALAVKRIRISDAAYTRRLTGDCRRFRDQRGYLQRPMSDEERDFPLAFGVMMYRDVEQFERLLRAIYRPQNYYCVHVDTRSSPTIRQAVYAIAGCFENVFVARRLVRVKWCGFTALDADLSCMEDLLVFEKKLFK